MSVAKASGASAIPHRIRFSLTGDGLADAHSCRAGLTRCVDSLLESSNVHTSIYKWRMTMNRTVRPLLVTCTVAAMGVGVQAQPPSPSPTTPATPKTPEQALKDYQIAKEACAAQSGIARSDCLRSTKERYKRDTNG